MSGDDTGHLNENKSGFSDPLLDCLVVLTKIHNHPISGDALKAGLPLVNHRLTPELFVRAAERAGLSARIVRRPIKKISALVLPAVLVLNGNHACVLTKFVDEDTVEVVLPESGVGTKQMSIKELENEYGGYAIFARPVYRFEDRADEFRIAKPRSWFWDTIWRYRKNYYNVAIAALMINIFAIASPLFVMNVYDRVVPNSAFETLWVLAIGVSIVFIFDFLLKILRGYLIDISGKKADISISSMLFQHVMGLCMEAKPVSTGAFVNNLQGFEAVREFFTSATLASVVDLPFVIFLIWIVYLIGGAVAVIPLVMVPIIIFVALFLEVPIREAAERSFIGATQKQAVLFESVNALETIKTVSAEGDRQRKWEYYVAYTAKAAMRSRLFSSIATNFTAYALQMVTVLVVIYGVYLFDEGEISMGGLIASVILSGRALAPLAQVATLITRFQQSKMGLEALNRIMQMPQERPEKKVFLHRAHQGGSIELDGVEFKYPKQEMFALENVSFKINAGEKVALLGKIGSGKTTILKLAMGLYKAQKGAMRIDNTDIVQIDPADVRKNVGYVGQSNVLFYGTLRENITKSAPWVDEKAIFRAADISGVSGFANHHPAGYDMMIGEGGEGLSGGQCQAIAVARAIIADPSILLLDEPTSMMDNNSELELVTKIKNYLSEKTLLLVTHKVSMLALVDRIIILDQGKVIADGAKADVLGMLNKGGQ